MSFSDSFLSVLPDAAQAHETAHPHQKPMQPHYAMPAVAMQHPGVAKTAVPPADPSFLQNGIANAIQGKTANMGAEPVITPYEQVQFVNPQFQQYTPQYQNLSHLLTGG